MNSVSTKYKSLLTSLVIHLSIVGIVLSLYIIYAEKKKCETCVCVNLQATHYEEPKPLKKIEPQKVSKPLVKAKPIVKKKPAPVVKKKLVPANKVIVVNEKIVPPVVEEPLVVILEPLEEVSQDKPLVQEEAVQQEVVAKSVVVQEKRPVPVVKVSPEVEYMNENLAIINALIKRNLSYQRMAKKRGMQGKAFVLFTIDKEGNIIEISASGEVASILKKSALKTVKKASSSFPHPSEVLTLQIPIVYKLH